MMLCELCGKEEHTIVTNDDEHFCSRECMHMYYFGPLHEFQNYDLPAHAIWFEDETISDLDLSGLPFSNESDLEFFELNRFTEIDPFITIKLAEECTELAHATLKNMSLKKDPNEDLNYISELSDVYNTLLLKISSLSEKQLKKFVLNVKMKRYRKIRG